MLEVGLKTSAQLIPVRMLNEYRYCPRLAYLEFIDGEFIENEHTIEGTRRHQTVDKGKGKLPKPEEVFGEFKARGVTLSSTDFGIISKLDIIESKDGKISPVEIKKGKGPDDGAWPADIIQIGAQMQILNDSGYDCEDGYIYYSASNKKIKIDFNDDLLIDLISIINSFQNNIEEEKIPPPLRNSRKCVGCSLAPICMPDEMNMILEEGEEDDIRSMYPRRDDSHPLVLQEQGAYLGKSGDRLTIKKNGKKLGDVRTFEISHVCLYGNAQVSTQALSELLDRNIPVLYFSYGGWFKGYTHSFTSKNVNLRMKQYELTNDHDVKLALAKEFIKGKVKNCRTMIRRNGTGDNEKALKEMKKMINKIEKVKDISSLLGVEGNAARIYFGSFCSMIKTNNNSDFDFKNRNRRPPTDPVNALLSFSYSALTKDITTSIISVGMDPMLGFYHTPRYGRPGLALDLMEEFRPIIADSVILSLINNEEITESDFIEKGISCNLNHEGRNKFFGAYERRLNQDVKHPLFGYRVTYRRIFETQVRLLSRYLTGEIERYIPFTTR